MQDDLDHVSDAETIQIAESGYNFYMKMLMYKESLGEHIFFIAFQCCRFAESGYILDIVEFSFSFAFCCEGFAFLDFCYTFRKLMCAAKP